jgi:hypothetical protein
MFEASTQAVLPCKPSLWRRLSALPLMSYYNRLFALVITCNAGVIWLGPGVLSMGTETLSAMVLINLSLATLVRQQYLINALACGKGLPFWRAAQRCGGGGHRVVRCAGRRAGGNAPA